VWSHAVIWGVREDMGRTTTLKDQYIVMHEAASRLGNADAKSAINNADAAGNASVMEAEEAIMVRDFDKAWKAQQRAAINYGLGHSTVNLIKNLMAVSALTDKIAIAEFETMHFKNEAPNAQRQQSEREQVANCNAEILLQELEDEKKAAVKKRGKHRRKRTQRENRAPDESSTTAFDVWSPSAIPIPAASEAAVAPAPADRPQEPKVVARSDDCECCVCMEAQKSHIFIPCGHFCACQACAVIISTTTQECPMCRSISSKVLKVYQ